MKAIKTIKITIKMKMQKQNAIYTLLLLLFLFCFFDGVPQKKNNSVLLNTQMTREKDLALILEVLFIFVNINFLQKLAVHK